MRPYCTCRQVATAYAAGIVLVAAAIGSKFFFAFVIFRQLQMNLPLSPNSSSSSEITSFRLWKDIPFPIKNRIYFFHVENPMEVVHFGEKPLLTQVGPFVYDQWKHKVDIKFSEKRSSVSYREISFFHHNSSESVSKNLPVSSVSAIASESRHPSLSYQVTSSVTSFDDTQRISASATTSSSATRKVRVLNVPLLAILERAKYFVEKAFLDSLILKTKSTLFVERTVDELLWGYEDPLLLQLKYFFPSLIPFTKFGWFMNQNASDQGQFEVYTGLDGDLTRYLNILSWCGRRRIDVWPPGGDTPCNSFHGASDGSAFGPNVQSSDVLRTFAPRMCRGAFNSTFIGSEKMRGVEVLRFMMDKHTFANASTNSANSCYCSSANSPRYSCPPSGTLNISACSFGAPVFLSQPHFLHADPALKSRFKGLSPSELKHGSTISVEPTTGVTTEAHGRLQLNGFVDNVEFFPQVFGQIADKLVFPVMWVEEAATMDDRTFNEVIRNRVVDKLRLCSAATAFLVALALFFLLSAVALTVQRWRFDSDLAMKRLVPVDAIESPSE